MATDVAGAGSDALRLEVPGEASDGVPLPRRGRLVLGSSSDRAGFVLEGQGIDDAHCAIGRVRDGGWAIKDLGSHYGTLLNGKRVASARLAAGDVIVLGSRRLLVSEVPAAGSSSSPSEPATPSAAERPRPTGGPLLPGFRIERRLGRGGMGEVYLAVQESLSRHVALKILSNELTADREFVLRFHSEARSAAALSHPNVVVVHDVGEVGGRHYLVMEYMPGGSLEERLARDGRLPWREALDVLHDAANGLTYAEEQGIVHRDIKPDNLMIATSGAVKIADLGLATPVDGQEASASADGKNYGTPHFLSPEQARGLPLDHRSDLYSLGATAYRLLTGRTPFGGATAREIIRARFTTTPAPLREHVPGIPAGLDALVLRLMEREPADRFASAQELLHEVDGLRLRADHGEVAVAGTKPGFPFLKLALFFALPLALLLLWLQLVDPPAPAGPGVDEAAFETKSGDASDVFGDTDDDGFFTARAAASGEEDEEGALRILELEAELAYRDLPAQTSERIAALEELIASYGATRVASQALEEVGRLKDAILEERVAAARADRDVGLAMDRLRNAAGWPPSGEALPRIGRILGRIADYQVSIAVASSPEFAARRAAFYAEVLTTSEELVRERLQRADARIAAGAFDELPDLYAELASSLALPEETDDDPEALTRLRDLADEVARRRERLGDDVEAFRRRLVLEDGAARGRALGPASGFQELLADLRFDHALERALALEAALQTGVLRERTHDLVGRLERARSALHLLEESLARGEWRRQTVSVPDERRSSPREAVGIGDEGLLVAGAQGAELVPWSTFTRESGGLAQLFRGRLTRPYTPEEDADIVTLLTLSAALRAVEPARRVLDPGRRGLLLPEEAAAMTEAFAPALEWPVDGEEHATRAAEEARVESEAVALLVTALTAGQEEAWTQAVASMEELLGVYGDSLVVLLLSDGSTAAGVAAASQEGGGSGD